MNIKHPVILVVDNYDSFTCNIVQILREHGGCSYDVILNDKVNVQEASGYDAILFSPGPGVPSDAPVMAELLRLYHREKSFLGICLGHQAVAEFFGMRLAGLGRVCHGINAAVRITDPSDYLFRDLPAEFNAGLYHSWAVVPEPGYDLSIKNMRVTAISADGVIMAIAHCKYDIRGVQFHPESYISSCGRKIIHNWIENLLVSFQA